MTETVEQLVEEQVQDAFSRALTNLKATYSFERKVNLGDYESKTASMYVQFDFPPEADGEEWLALAREACFRAESIVYERLGIEAELTEGNGLREVRRVMQAFPGAVVEPTDGGDDLPMVPPFSREALRELPRGSQELKDAYAANDEWGRRHQAKYPNKWWDNRPKKASGEYDRTNPDFTHKDHKVGFFMPK